MGDFGSRLREARERKGISLRQIAAATKISVGALEGLERNDISKLPGGIFSRAFVRSYAIEVGLDPDETVRYFLQQFGSEVGPIVQPAAPPPPVTPARPAQRPPARYVPPPTPDVTDEVDFESKQRMAGVVLKLALVSLPIAASILYFTSRGASRATGTPTATPEATTSATHGTNTGEPGSAAATPVGTPTPAPTETVPVAPSVTTPAAPVVTPPVTPASQAIPPAASAEPAGAEIGIEIAPSADCWTKLTIDGDLVVSRIVAAGEREQHQFRESAILQVGDAAACTFTLDGRPAKSLGGAGQVREVRLTRENYRAFIR